MKRPLIAITVYAESPDQARAILDAIAGVGIPSSSRAQHTSSPLYVFKTDQLPGLQKWAERPEGVSASELASFLGTNTRSIPPIVNGWKRRATILGIPFESLVRIQSVTNDKKKKCAIYALTPAGMAMVTK